MKVLIIGTGGREAAFARSLSRSPQSPVTALFGEYENITATQLGAEFSKGDPLDPQACLAAAQKFTADVVIVSGDAPLAAGVVDALEAGEFLVFGPNKEGAKLEWDKNFTRDIVAQMQHNLNPEFVLVKSVAELKDALSRFQGKVVLKPLVLTGGKGVKVQSVHFTDPLSEGTEMLNQYSHILVEECLVGPEFTIQVFTDGTSILRGPVSYDYPYRLADDLGDGTGGMGCYTLPDGLLPFLSTEQREQAFQFIEEFLGKLRERGIKFNGVLNPAFFVTNEGLKLIEINARAGDPEIINILSLLEGDVLTLVTSIARGELQPELFSFKEQGSVLVYLVEEEYPSSGTPRKFALPALGDVTATYASAELREDATWSRGSSRVVALTYIAETVEAARQAIYSKLDSWTVLDYRPDIASSRDIQQQQAKLSI